MRRSRRDDSPLVDDGDAITQRRGFIQLVRGQQHRVAIELHAANLRVQFMARLRIEARRRFIENDHLGAMHKRQGQGQPLPLPAR